MRNVPDITHAPVITALDHGVENPRLAEALPGRTWHLLDEATWTLTPWDPAGTTKGGVKCPEPYPPSPTRR